MTESLVALFREEGVEATFEAGRVLLRSSMRVGRPRRAEVAAPEALDRDRGAAWVRGVSAALLTAKAIDEESFADWARSLRVHLDRGAFHEGFTALGADPPYRLPFADDLFLHFAIERDDGERVLTESDVAHRGLGGDRLERAAASLLLHHSRTLEALPVEGAPQLTRLVCGDGRDAARCMIFDAVDWFRAMDGALLALPTPTHLYVACEDDADLLFARIRRHRDAGDPILHDGLIRWRGGRRA